MDEQHSCEHCGKVYKSVSSLRNHKSIYHRKKKAAPASNYLPAPLYYEWLLSLITIVEATCRCTSLTRSYFPGWPQEDLSEGAQCPYCDKVLKYKSNLKIHIRDHHSDSQICHGCPHCGKTFKSSGSLRDHKSKYHKGYWFSLLYITLPNKYICNNISPNTNGNVS